jgi:hypothetical protein
VDGVTTLTSSTCPAGPFFIIIDQETDSNAGSGTYPLSSHYSSITMTCNSSSMISPPGGVGPMISCSNGTVAFNANFSGSFPAAQLAGQANMTGKAVIQ